jgi:glucuronide carrier protein
MASPAVNAVKLRVSQYLGYAGGEVANNLTFSTVSAFLLIYYTDVAGISAAAAGTLFIVVRIWGGVTDLIAGRVVDTTESRWGKFRPYVLFGSAPLLGLLVAMFSIPGGLSDSGKLAWAILSYALFQLAYSFVNIAFGSLAAAMTQEPDERDRLSTGRVVAASLTILLIAVAISPQISGGGDLQRSLTITTIVFAVAGMALYVWCFAVSRETVPRAPGRVSALDTLQMVRRNTPLILLCASSVLFLCGMFSLQTVAVYYARDVLGNSNLYIVMTIVQTVAMVAASALITQAVERIGKKRVYVAASVIGTLTGIGVAIAPSSIPAIGIACWGGVGLALGVVNTLIFSIQADTVDYGEWKTGVRAEGGSYSILSFMRKTGQGIGGGLAAFAIGIGGYVSGASEQSDAALTSIRVAAGAIPAVAMLGAGAVMLAYPLSQSALRRMVGEVAERRARGQLDPLLVVPGATS